MSGHDCHGCGAQGEPHTDSDFENFFHKRSWACDRCGHQENLWDIYIESLKFENPHKSPIALLGFGGQTIISTKIDPESSLFVNFADHGVPDDAEILEVQLSSWTPDSDGALIAPAVRLDRLHWRSMPHRLQIYPVPFDGTATPETYTDPRLGMMVTWGISPREAEEGALYAASKAFAHGRYREAVIPAQIALELKLNQVLTNHYVQYGNAGNFLRNRVSYGHQLRFLMPSLFALSDAPELPKVVRESLFQLKAARDEVGHTNAQQDRASVARMLVGSFFGYRYLVAYGHLIAVNATDHHANAG